MVTLKTRCSHRQPVTMESLALALQTNQFLWEGLDWSNLAEDNWWPVLLGIWCWDFRLHKRREMSLAEKLLSS